jgi:hypothetical protein
MAAAPGTFAEGYNVAADGWYTELSTLWPGQGMSLKIDEVLFKGRSDFQVHLDAGTNRACACRIDACQRSTPRGLTAFI